MSRSLSRCRLISFHGFCDLISASSSGATRSAHLIPTNDHAGLVPIHVENDLARIRFPEEPEIKGSAPAKRREEAGSPVLEGEVEEGIVGVGHVDSRLQEQVSARSPATEVLRTGGGGVVGAVATNRRDEKAGAVERKSAARSPQRTRVVRAKLVSREIIEAGESNAVR